MPEFSQFFPALLLGTMLVLTLILLPLLHDEQQRNDEPAVRNGADRVAAGAEARALRVNRSAETQPIHLTPDH